MLGQLNKLAAIVRGRLSTGDADDDDGQADRESSCGELNGC